MQVQHMHDRSNPPSPPQPHRSRMGRSAITIAPHRSQPGVAQGQRQASLPGQSLAEQPNVQIRPNAGASSLATQHRSHGSAHSERMSQQVLPEGNANAASHLSHVMPGVRHNDAALPAAARRGEGMSPRMSALAQQMAAAAQNENSVIARFRHHVRLPGEAVQDGNEVDLLSSMPQSSRDGSRQQSVAVPQANGKKRA